MLIKQFQLVILLLCALLLSGNAVAKGDKGINTIVDNGYMRVGVSGNQPPFVMHGAAGELMGFDIDLARSLAAAMNIDVQFVEMPFNELLTALDKRKIDAVISGLDITLERSSRALFAGPYALSGKSVLTKKSSIERFSNINDLNSSTVKALALEGSTSAEFVKTIMPKAQLITIKDYSDGINLLKNDEADFMIADMAVCALSVILNPAANLATTPKPLSLQPVGIAVNHKHIGLHNLMSNYLKSYEALGFTEQLRKKWFENGDWVKLLPGQQIQL
ncbi:MAG: transporter substrate-binding domain-containing protein [Sinobacterium sp.]|nr:transporter substrate-binding domain-containing protein [Sinobacterium sp.]